MNCPCTSVKNLVLSVIIRCLKRWTVRLVCNLVISMSSVWLLRKLWSMLTHVKLIDLNFIQDLGVLFIATQLLKSNKHMVSLNFFYMNYSWKLFKTCLWNIQEPTRKKQWISFFFSFLIFQRETRVEKGGNETPMK